MIHVDAGPDDEKELVEGVATDRKARPRAMGSRLFRLRFKKITTK
jgi:hypothetical protein